ncbi:MAG: hypothetical protein EU549_05115 [Promethearchaeota archaeon]|nr:MAG: hypothetical protein EU549_05115 [Candidatus Lokiarchaeota archaeon]
MEEVWDLSFIEETPLDDKNKFDNFFLKNLETDQNQCEYKTFDDILSLIIQTPLNQKVTRNGVDLFFMGYREIENDGQNIEYLFCFKVICDRCDKNFLFKQNIIFNSNSYLIDPSYFNSECPVCKQNFHMNAYISDWWFD